MSAHLVSKRHGPVILAGDFNSYVGSEGGPKASGSQKLHGRLLVEMIYNNDLFITSLSSLSTGPSYTYFKEDTQTITDYIIMDAIHAPLAMDCQIYDHHPLNSSDHLPLSLTISLAPTVSSARVQCRMNWSAAVKDRLIEAYATAVGEIVRPLLGRAYKSTSSLNDEVCQVSAAIVQAALSTTPVRKQGKGKKCFSNDPELRKLSSKCKTAWKQWKKTGSPL